MAAYMPPISRKKKVDEKYSPNTFRVFGNLSDSRNIGEFKPTSTISDRVTDFGPSKAVPYDSVHNTKTHKPHAWSAEFLRQNCRFVNEPICMVFTDKDKDIHVPWWPEDVASVPQHQPNHTLDTTFRKDYGSLTDRPLRLTRHGCNPNVNPALGIAPVNQLQQPDGSQRLCKEKISYEHMYNSRGGKFHSYPIRGKRHGSFVWDGIPTSMASEYCNKPGYHGSQTNDPITGLDSKNQSKSSTPQNKTRSDNLLERKSSIEKLPKLESPS